MELTAGCFPPICANLMEKRPGPRCSLHGSPLRDPEGPLRNPKGIPSSSPRNPDPDGDFLGAMEYE